MSNEDKKKPQDENEIDLNLALFSLEDQAKLLPPEEVNIIQLNAEPHDDGQRINVTVEISPFQKRPHMEFVLTDVEDQIISTVSFVEPINWKIEFTMHLRMEPAQGPLDLQGQLFYPDDGPQAEPVTVRFTLPQA
jgi:hypothetical protein